MVVESEVERKNVGFGKRSELLEEKKGILSIMKIRMSGKKMGLNLRSRNVSLRQSEQSFQGLFRALVLLNCGPVESPIGWMDVSFSILCSLPLIFQ